MAVGPFLVNFGFSEACTNEITDKIPVAVGAIMAWVGRVRAGGLTWYGARKTS